jgi:hypothetical protein
VQLPQVASQIKKGKVVLANVVVPNTGSLSTFATPVTAIILTPGLQILHIALTGGGFNLEWMDFVVAPNTIKIEAESYATMFGIQTEATTDEGGGLNVGWTDANDWMNYTVNVPTTGTYTANFRVASAVATGKIELRNQAGAVLATLIQGTTNGWQAWVTKAGSTSFNLSAGLQTLRIYYTGAGLNLNWFELVPPVAVKSAEIAPEISNANSIKSLAYPNPVFNSLTINMNGNSYEQVVVTDLLGKVQASMSVNDEDELSIDFTSYPKGIYLVRLSNGNSIEYLKVVKE